jgi:hypothetical protein
MLRLFGLHRRLDGELHWHVALAFRVFAALLQVCPEVGWCCDPLSPGGDGLSKSTFRRLGALDSHFGEFI